jgi:hypothetical protein
VQSRNGGSSVGEPPEVTDPRPSAKPLPPGLVSLQEFRARGVLRVEGFHGAELVAARRLALDGR